MEARHAVRSSGVIAALAAFNRARHSAFCFAVIRTLPAFMDARHAVRSSGVIAALAAFNRARHSAFSSAVIRALLALMEARQARRWATDLKDHTFRIASLFTGAMTFFKVSPCYRSLNETENLSLTKIHQWQISCHFKVVRNLQRFQIFNKWEPPP